MTRTDNDSWAITESVGVTALGVAAARAAETESDNAVINDPFARVFVDAAGVGIWNVYSNTALLADNTDIEPSVRDRVRLMIDFMAMRTAFFDDFFLGAAASGVRQVVILASGLDSRAWRLPWPDGTVVYELDQPKVLEFKSTTLREHGAHPIARVENIPVDLRQDWPMALQQAGFDPSQPCAWSAEGLVRYLPARAQDLLFERVHALSAPGSWVASNVPASGSFDPEGVRRMREEMQGVRDAAAKLIDTDVPEFEDLWYAEERTALAEWLDERGWEVSATTFTELLTRYGREVSYDSESASMPTQFVSARR
ncbi:class I SAM-dependent methyltransferase [Mycobacterium spongiae]|uniref:S-adenosyl-L-methionine-dependent methyltransferase n=1 Tax=Mycobacterium spongiae TaxID=886343 RepID=A0A975K0W8_9MYCO|nr:class I SAM-dependent methyltransferase [Mycobacterium spongiae]QUR69331.1 SAM-dependent methyltransferase [Mycobacterium spongiae]